MHTLQEFHRVVPPHWPSSKNAVGTKRFTGQLPLQEHETFSKITSCRLLKNVRALQQNFCFRALQQNVFHCSNFLSFSRCIALQQIFAAEQYSVLQHIVVCCSVLQFYLRNESFRVTEGLLLYRLLQCVAVRCSMLQCVAVFAIPKTSIIPSDRRASALSYLAACCSVLHYVAVCRSALQCAAERCSALQSVAIPKTSTIPCGRRASALSYIAACCSVLQYQAVSGSALQCAAIPKTSIIPCDRRASALSISSNAASPGRCSVSQCVAARCSAQKAAAESRCRSTRWKIASILRLSANTLRRNIPKSQFVTKLNM